MFGVFINRATFEACIVQCDTKRFDELYYDIESKWECVYCSPIFDEAQRVRKRAEDVMTISGVKFA